MTVVFLVSTLLATLAPPALGGSIRNEDAREYKITVHWEDLSPPETFTLEPGKERHFEEKRATVELVGKKDNIYMHPEEQVVIRSGVMRRISEPEAEQQ